MQVISIKSYPLLLLFSAVGINAAVFNVPDYAPLAGLTAREVEAYESGLGSKAIGSQPRPLPPSDTNFKLVFDKDHPFVKPRSSDQRGPCPGLNTLANHGYLPHTGVATPAQIVNAVIDGFNMEYNTALIITYGAFLGNGNHLTNLLSIGGVSGLTGPAPPAPALAGGLNVHGTFEGDASLTRSDAYLGNNHDINMTLFNQLIDTMNAVGGGRYNLIAAADHRYARIQDSIARNPTFDLGNPRFLTAYGEASFPLAFFSNLSEPDVALGTSPENIRSFFLDHKFPEGFHRRGTPFDGGNIIQAIMDAHPMTPGANDGVHVNSFHEVDVLQGQPTVSCAVYRRFVNITLALYPNPTGALRKALAGNLKNWYLSIDPTCVEVVPYN